MGLLYILSYVGIFFQMCFITIALAAGLYYISGKLRKWIVGSFLEVKSLEVKFVNFVVNFGDLMSLEAVVGLVLFVDTFIISFEALAK